MRVLGGRWPGSWVRCEHRPIRYRGRRVLRSAGKWPRRLSEAKTPKHCPPAISGVPWGKMRSAAVSRSCSLRSPVLEHIAMHRPIGALPEQPDVRPRRHRIQDVPQPGDDKSGAGPSGPQLPPAALRCRAAEACPILFCRFDPIGASLDAAPLKKSASDATRSPSRPNLPKRPPVQKSQRKILWGTKVFCRGIPGLFSPNFAPSPGRVLLW